MCSAMQSMLLIIVIVDTVCRRCGPGQCEDFALESPECRGLVKGKHGVIAVTGPMQQTAEGRGHYLTLCLCDSTNASSRFTASWKLPYAVCV